MTRQMLEDRRIDFAVIIIGNIEALPDSKAGNQIVVGKTSTFRNQHSSNIHQTAKDRVSSTPFAAGNTVGGANLTLTGSRTITRQSRRNDQRPNQRFHPFLGHRRHTEHPPAKGGGEATFLSFNPRPSLNLRENPLQDHPCTKECEPRKARNPRKSRHAVLQVCSFGEPGEAEAGAEGASANPPAGGDRDRHARERPVDPPVGPQGFEPWTKGL